MTSDHFTDTPPAALLRQFFDYYQSNLSLNAQRAGLLVFILIQILFFTGYSAFQRMRIEDDTSRTLRNTALLKAQQFEASKTAMHYQMRTIGNAILLNHSVNPEKTAPFLTQEREQDWLDVVIVFNAEGNFVASSGAMPLEHVLRGPLLGNGTFRDSPLFGQLQRKEIHESFFYLYSRGLNEYLIGLAVPVYNIQGQFLGGAVGYLKSSTLGYLAQEMEGKGLDLGPGGTMALLDHKTGFLFSRIGTGARSQLNYGDYKGNALMNYASDIATVHRYISPEDGASRLGIFLNINNRKWVLAVTLSESDILHDWYIQNIVSSFIVLVMVLLQWQLLHYARVNFIQRARLILESRQDPLTRLANRRYFDEWTHKLCSQARRYNETLSLLCCDLDYFKKINDQYGHDVGDAVLKHVANILSGVLRESDIAARFGGEEFVVVLPHTDIFGAFQVAERIRTKFADQMTEFNGLFVYFTASFGVAQITTDELKQPDGIHLTLKRADKALYRSKQDGRNRTTAAERGSDTQHN